MALMARPKKPDKHKKQQFQVRLHPVVRDRLKQLAERNMSDVTEEVRIAIREHLKRAGLWPSDATD